MENLQENERPLEEAPLENDHTAQEPNILAPVQESVDWKQFALDIVETLLLAVVLFLGINAISARVRVDGFSMRPTLEDGEFILVSKLSYRLANIERGDIVVFHYPVDPTQELIKRVIGLPGDHIKIAEGKVIVNGQVLTEPYIAANPLYAGEWLVPENKLFVLGDNRNDSSDSHSWGYLPQDNLVGKAVVIYWPPPFWDIIKHEQLLVQ